MILDKIIAYKKKEILPNTPPVDLALLKDLPATNNFKAALKRKESESIKIIAESKKGSPSKGIFNDDYDPCLNAMRYLAGGADCMSVLTDKKFFFGSSEDFISVRKAVPSLPLIRKDFLIDERQIAEARVIGADAVLLIASCLEEGELRDLSGFAKELNLSVLLEVHNEAEAETAVKINADLIGINNRNLSTFETSLDNTYNILPHIKKEGVVTVSESGIKTRKDCIALENAGVDAILVGETLMTSGDPSLECRLLKGSM